MKHKWSDEILLAEMAAIGSQVSSCNQESQDLVKTIQLAVIKSKNFRRRIKEQQCAFLHNPYSSSFDNNENRFGTEEQDPSQHLLRRPYLRKLLFVPNSKFCFSTLNSSSSSDSFVYQDFNKKESTENETVQDSETDIDTTTVPSTSPIPIVKHNTIPKTTIKSPTKNGTISAAECKSDETVIDMKEEDENSPLIAGANRPLENSVKVILENEKKATNQPQKIESANAVPPPPPPMDGLNTNNSLKNTIWSDVGDTTIDTEQIEKFASNHVEEFSKGRKSFGQQSNNEVVRPGEAVRCKNGNNLVEKKLTGTLSTDRRRNIEIAMKRFEKVDEIIDVITNLQYEKITPEDVDILLRIIPTAEEVNGLKNASSISNLNKEDHFSQRLGEIDAKVRLEGLRFILEWKKTVNGIEEKYTTIMKIADEIMKKSTQLQKIFKIIHTLSDKILQQSQPVSSIQKLVNLLKRKTKDGKSKFASICVKYITTETRETSDTFTELSSLLKKSSKIHIIELQEVLSNYKCEHNKFCELLNSEKSNTTDTQNHDKLLDLSKQIATKLETLEKLKSKTELDLKERMNYFGIFKDEYAQQPLFFESFLDFISVLQQEETIQNAEKRRNIEIEARKADRKIKQNQTPKQSQSIPQPKKRKSRASASNILINNRERAPIHGEDLEVLLKL